MIALDLPEVISKNAEVLICFNLMYLRQLSWFWIEQSIYWSADNLLFIFLSIGQMLVLFTDNIP